MESSLPPASIENRTGRMHNPPHPGETFREDVLPALDLTVTQAAKELGINRVTLSRVLNGKAGIRIDLALRLEAWLDGPTAESRLNIGTARPRPLAGRAASAGSWSQALAVGLQQLG